MRSRLRSSLLGLLLTLGLAAPAAGQGANPAAPTAEAPVPVVPYMCAAVAAGLVLLLVCMPARRD